MVVDPARAVRTAVDRLEPPPRLVDWSILALVCAELATGVLSLGTGHPDGWWVFWSHGVMGFVLVALLGYKFRRVARRVVTPTLWDRATGLSLLTATLAVATLATGIYWVLGGNFRVLFWTAMNVHIGLGLVLLPVVLVHLVTRFRPPRRADFEGRRTALAYAGLVVAGALAWRTQTALNRALDTAGTTRRFTGSKPVDVATGVDDGGDGGADGPDGSGGTDGTDDADGADDADGTGDADGEGSDVGGAFPVTSWVADDPDPVDRAAWTLRVGGLVDEPLELDYAELDPGTDRRALLDCTSGWYTVQDWRGVRVGDLLDRAGVREGAAWVRFTSVTGYRWAIPLAEAREALLATHVGGDPLSHGHGAPLRLVAPGRRGFQWVKWVESVEVREGRDLGQYVAVLVSGFVEDRN